jgi:hypothetical protein
VGTLSDRGRDALVRRQKQAAGVAVTYARKADASTVQLTAVPGQAVARSGELPGRVEIAERDYQIAVTDLMVGGAEVKPQLGDRITETINGTACVFEVMQPETGEPGARYGSQWRAFYRVHCKRVL